MMSLVDAIALLRNTPAERLTADQLAELRQVVESNPAIASLVGGQAALDQYLNDAEKAASRNAKTAEHDSAVASTHPSDTFCVQRSHGRTLGLIALVLLSGVGVYFLWPAEKPPVAVSSTDKSVNPATQAAVEPTAKQPEPPKPDRKVKQPPTAKEEPEAAKPEVPTWQDWQVKLAGGARMAERVRWDFSDPTHHRPQMLLEVTGGGAELSAQQQVDHRNWLRIALAEGTQGNGGQIEVRADGRPVARFTLTKAGVYAVPLGHLRGKNVRLTVAHLPGPKPEAVVWDTVRLVADKSGVAWTPLKPQNAQSSGGATLQIQPDNSVIVTGTNVAADQYSITATMPNLRVQAIRLEAMRDAALPGGGPGRGAQGEYIVSKFSASQTESDEQYTQLLGRYVRIELQPQQQSLALSEVEVFSGGKNVALGKVSMQSSLDGLAVSEFGVDGNTHGTLDRMLTSIARTSPSIPGGWWEVDLGREYPLERIVLWNGPEHLAKHLMNYRIVVLDMHRNVVWHHFNPDFPAPSQSYGPFVISRSPLEMQTAIVRTTAARSEAPWLVQSLAQAAGTGPRLAEACDYIFPLGRSGDDQGKLSLAQRQVTFRIQHQDAPPADGKPNEAHHDNLGRFRISVTEDPVPIAPEPPTELVPLLPGVESSPAQSPATQQANASAAPQPTTPVPAAPTTEKPSTPQRAPNVLARDYAWEGWTVASDPTALAVPKYHWDPSHTAAPKIEPRFTMVGRSATLSQTRRIEPAGAWLRLRAGQTAESSPVGHIEVRADGRPIARFETQAVEEAPDRLVSLADFVGRQVKLELVYLPGNDSETIDFLAPTFVASPQDAGFVKWQTPEPVALGTRWKSTLKALPDHSILAGGENSKGEVYLITVRMPPQKVTAVRLEAIPHASLPFNGPGRGYRGSFNLGRFWAEIVDPNRKPETRSGRYVRFELPGHERSLQLAELQAFSGGKNVALGKPASQPSVMFNGLPKLAVDDLIGESYDHRGGVAFASTGEKTPNVWWEVDLQQEYPIERVVVWNRQASGPEMANHRILILDKDRKPTWDHTSPDFAVPALAYEFPYAPRPIRFSAADVSFDVRMRAGYPPLPDPIKIVYPPLNESVPGWGVHNVPGRMQVAVFTVAPDQNLAGQLVRFELGDFQPLSTALGRFRLSVTTATEPHKAIRPMMIVERNK